MAKALRAGPGFPGLLDRLRMALAEDLGAGGDITSNALVDASRTVRAAFVAKRPGVVAGTRLPWAVFHLAADPGAFDGDLREKADAVLRDAVAGRAPWEDADAVLRGPATGIVYRPASRDGDPAVPGATLAEVSGPARAILAGERLALNLLCRLSGVATQAAAFVAAVRGTNAAILDTRKTTPLWRDLEKMAVRAGGGTSHRFGLHDQVLIKDNHLVLGPSGGAFDPAEAVRAARRAAGPGVAVEVEVVSAEGLERVLDAGPDMILLDNMPAEAMRDAVARAREHERRTGCRPLLEASGGISMQTIRRVAETGVDRISVGSLTHSVIALDISLEFIAD